MLTTLPGRGRHGADPHLRDSKGKTPLDKAREQHTAGHETVARLLETLDDFGAEEQLLDDDGLPVGRWGDHLPRSAC